ncbi:AraC family transcriptional regulator [Streptomyces sp. NPDC005507]|uniref:AraC family transcriptional regulator n=1 Tax=Streptomyces sp. NPDC005507 TaxID=3154885 RepID=UPI0033BDB672
MDAIDGLLATMKIENSRYVRVEARAPWGISFPSRHLARLILISSGSCWLTTDGMGKPEHLKTNDCVLIRANVEFALRDEPGSDVVDCDASFAQAGGDSVRLGGEGGLTEIVSSRFAFDAVAAEPLFALLPSAFRLSLDNTSGELLRTTFELIARETAADGIGADFVTSRLSDVLFVQAMRAACTTVGGSAIGWLAALRDPQLAAAMQQMHADLSHPWTVDALAHEAGMSRSAFAALFKERAGNTPLSYLASWRMYRAKTLLRETPLSIQEIAARVGYDTGTALSRAFRRREGMAPGAWRQLMNTRALSTSQGKLTHVTDP